MNFELDMENRDPSGVNSHLGTLMFNDIFAEPDGSHSFDCIWKGANACFECWKSLTYRFLSTCFGICIAAEWGVYFAYLAFYHIWYITPILKMYEMNCAVCKKIYHLCINCLIEPCCEACGGVFVHFNRNK